MFARPFYTSNYSRVLGIGVSLVPRKKSKHRCVCCLVPLKKEALWEILHLPTCQDKSSSYEGHIMFLPCWGGDRLRHPSSSAQGHAMLMTPSSISGLTCQHVCHRKTPHVTLWRAYPAVCPSGDEQASTVLQLPAL